MMQFTITARAVRGGRWQPRVKLDSYVIWTSAYSYPTRTRAEQAGREAFAAALAESLRTQQLPLDDARPIDAETSPLRAVS